MRKFMYMTALTVGCAALGFTAQAQDSKEEALVYAQEYAGADEIDVTAGAVKCQIFTWEGDTVKVEAAEEDLVNCRQEGRELEILCGKSGGVQLFGDLFSSEEKQLVRIYLPQTEVRSLDIEAGAASVEIDDVQCQELGVEVGAGELTFAGAVSREVSVECGAGSAALNLEGTVADFNYEMECEAGDITVENGPSIDGMGENRLNNGALKEMDLECAAGSIEISFTDQQANS